VIEKVRALVMRKDVLGLVAVASERRRTERVIDAIVDFVEWVCYVQRFGPKRAIEQHNSNERELHLSDEVVSPRFLGKSTEISRVIGSNL
jgi:hypothetical protein